MEVIKVVQEENKSYDYINILRAVMELPFNVGKNLLADFLNGDYKNKSVIKNKLDQLHTFDTLHWEKEEIFKKIDELTANGMLEWITSEYNRFIKVLSITVKGQNEIIKPTMLEKSLNNKVSFSEAEITEGERKEFEELDAFLNGYNENQKKAIISQAKNILCVAGAGTGKTTVLTKRIEFLIRHRGVNPKDILAITFTRKARREMEQRLKDNGIFGVNVNTFNSFCEKTLKKHEQEIYGRPMSVQSYGDKILAMNMALAHLGINMEDAITNYFKPQQRRFKTPNQLANSFMNDCYSVMEYFKVTGEEEYDFSEHAEAASKKNARMIYDINNYLKQHMDLQGFRDYSDQLLDSIKFFKEQKEHVPAFTHILVDEYQDVNATQRELLELLNAPNFFVVGDPRQSIFGWRGSDIKYILEFEKEQQKCEVIHLTKNYRSNKKLVAFMNEAISEMGLPDLEHHHEEDSDINIKNFDSEHAEREYVIEQILKSDLPRREIFVLARTNRQLQELSNLLKIAKIPHIIKTDEQKKPIEGKSGDITLATIHAIKGLEASHVFLLGATEQNFPCKASDHPAVEIVKMDTYNKTEEEKRLFYVAVSRARKKLTITHNGKKPTYFLTEKLQRLSRS